MGPGRLRAVVLGMTIATLAIVLVTSSLFNPGVLAQVMGQKKVDGRVLDKDGTPIPNVEVRAYDEGRQIGKTARSDSQGRYQITFEARSTVDTLRYDPDLRKWNPGIIQLLSGSENNSIFKVLSRLGEASPQIVVILRIEDIMSTLETIYFLDRDAGVDRNVMVKKYAPTIKAVRFLLERVSDPEVRQSFQDRFSTLSRRYFGVK